MGVQFLNEAYLTSKNGRHEAISKLTGRHSWILTTFFFLHITKFEEEVLLNNRYLARQTYQQHGRGHSEYLLPLDGLPTDRRTSTVVSTGVRRHFATCVGLVEAGCSLVGVDRWHCICRMSEKGVCCIGGERERERGREGERRGRGGEADMIYQSMPLILRN